MENADADLTANASKFNEYHDNIIISMEEEHKIVEYQETMKVDVKNIPKNKNIWRPIYEVIDASSFEETDIFAQAFLDLCKNSPNQPQFLLSEVKVVLKKKAMEQGLN